MAGLAFSMLTLGWRGDAREWITGCESIGMKALPGMIREPRPRLPALESFFGSSPEWIYLGGHFSGDDLYNDREYSGDRDEGVICTFEPKRVKVRSHWKRATLDKGTSSFGLDSSCRVTFWGGCNVASESATVLTMMKVFGPHLLIGFSDTTSPRLMSAVIGTSKGQGDFFGKLRARADPTNANVVRDVWFESMLASEVARTAYPRYRVFDSSGQEWRLTRNRRDPKRALVVSKGRKLSV